MHIGGFRAGSSGWNAEVTLNDIVEGYQTFDEQDRKRISLIVVTGSITENGRRDEFDRMADLLKKLESIVFPFEEDGAGTIRVFPVPGPNDISEPRADPDYTEFERFLHEFVPQHALLGGGKAGPYVAKLKGITLIGLCPTQAVLKGEEPDCNAAAQQLMSGIELLSNFCYRKDSVPKVAVSAGAELAIGDYSQHEYFLNLCDNLRAKAPLDFHLFTDGTMDSIGPRPLGLPVPCVSAQLSNGERPDHRRLNLIIFRESPKPGDYVRETFLTTAAVAGAVRRQRPSGRLGQPFQTYKGHRREPDFTGCLGKMVDAIQTEIFQNAKRFVAIEGIEGSGKRLLFDHLAKGEWFPEGQNHRIETVVIRGDSIPKTFAGVKEGDNPVLVVLDEERRAIKNGTALWEHDSAVFQWFDSKINNYRAVVYLVAPHRNKFKPRPDGLRQLFHSLKAVEIDPDEYNKLVLAISGTVPLDTRDLRAAFGRQVGMLDHVYAVSKTIIQQKPATWPISRETSRQMLLDSIKVPEVEHAASNFVDSIYKTLELRGERFVEIVAGQLRSHPFPETEISIPLSTLAAAMPGLRGGALDAMVERLRDLGIAVQVGDHLRVNAPLNYIAALLREAIKVGFLTMAEAESTSESDRQDMSYLSRDESYRFDGLTFLESILQANHLIIYLDTRDEGADDVVQNASRWVEDHEMEILERHSVIIVVGEASEEVEGRLRQTLPSPFVERMPRGPHVARSVIQKVLEAHEKRRKDEVGPEEAR